MPVTLSPLEEAEIPAFVRLELEAFKPHPRIPILWPNGYTPDLYAFYEASKAKAFRDASARLIKAVDEERNVMVGVAQWTFALDPAARAKDEPTPPDAEPPSNWPRGGNWGVRRYFAINIENIVKEFFDGQRFIMLDILVVDPTSHRQGIGARLLEWGVRQADHLGVPMALESTPTGLALYKRFGFVESRVIKADMRQFGWDQPYDEEAAKRVWMIRQPQPLRQ